MAQGHLDIAILPEALDPAAARGPELFRDELVVVVWPGHRFTAMPYVTAKDFDSQTYLTYSLASRPGFESEGLWSREDAMPLRKQNLGSVDAVCELIGAKVGVSVLSRWGVHREIATGMLAAVQAGAAGLPIAWRALVSDNQPKDAPARRVAADLEERFAQPPTVEGGNPAS